MICDSPVFIDRDDKFTIKLKSFRGSEGLWELLTRKNVNKEGVNKTDLKTYNKI